MIKLKETKDLEALRAHAIQLDRGFKSLLRKHATLQRENLELRGFSVEQMELTFELPGEDKPAAAPKDEDKPTKGKRKTKPRSSGSRTPQPKLPRQTIDSPLAPCQCSDCGQPIIAFDSWDEAEAVTVTKTVYSVVAERRQKGRCACDDKVHVAPSQVMRMRRGGRYTVELAAHVATNKWADHLPLERQVRRMLRAGLEASSQALFDQTHALADELRPIFRAIRAELLRSAVLGVDETTWKLFGKQGRDYRAAIGLSTPQASCYLFLDNKEKESIDRVLAGFSGTLVCDCNASYDWVAQQRRDEGDPLIVIAHCWAHALRRFRAAEIDFPVARKMLRLIGKLYKIDRKAGIFPGDQATQARRAKLRATHSTKVLAQIRCLAKKLLDLPKVSIREHAAYLLGHWQGFTTFIDDPLVPLDNNGTERDLRQLVQGRKNHYGSASDRGLETAAILLSLIQTCLKLGVEPEGYLIEAIRRIRADPGDIYLPRHALADQLS